MKPGPGMYESLSDMKKTAPRYGFGTEKRPEVARKSMSPGPGGYEAKKVIGAEGTQKSMSPKLSLDYKVKNDKLVPGPGQYEFHLKAMKTAPNYGIGTSKRSQNASPGMKGVSTDPGAYNPNSTFTKRSSPNYRMGSETRKMFDDKHTKSVPGPGNYAIGSKAFENRHGWSMGAKGKDMSKLIVPGAGTYEPVSDS